MNLCRFGWSRRKARQAPLRASKKYPLSFSDFHTSKVYNAGWLRNVPYLREVLPYPTLRMQTEAAKERGVVDGD